MSADAWPTAGRAPYPAWPGPARGVTALAAVGAAPVWFGRTTTCTPPGPTRWRCRRSRSVIGILSSRRQIA
jgi:hypothetical protein